MRDALLRVCGDDVEVIATSKEPRIHPLFGELTALDVTDQASVWKAFERHSPTHITHLAGIAASSSASANPHATWQVHLSGALNLAAAILAQNPDCWLLHVGSALVYGDSAKSGLPLDEETLLAPTDEYAASKAAADLALGALAHRGLKCVRLRPFNHSGPGQTEAFVIPAFAMQIAKIEAGLAPPVMRVGNLDAERDFLDVRDVAHAYALAARQASLLEPGTIFNIASGVTRRIGDILDQLLARAELKIRIERDLTRLRPTELRRVIGDARRAKERLGWSPEHRFEDLISDVLNDCRARVAGA
jgi:GDP-4-dehydro-6-deoxy-D-mannose reductase